jgi:hypothetical protein
VTATRDSRAGIGTPAGLSLAVEYGFEVDSGAVGDARRGVAATEVRGTPELRR